MGTEQRRALGGLIMPRPLPHQLSKQQGFTLLELVIVIIIISFLMTLGFDRLAKLQVQAERASMQQIIGHLQSAISLTISEHIAKDNIAGLRRYIETNPMGLLAETPVNYLGSYSEPPSNEAKPYWWYHARTRTLYYHASNVEYFDSDNSKRGVAKFKILAVYDDINGNAQFDQGDSFRGLRLTPLTQYHWRTKPMDPDDYLKEASGNK